jgi:hypothetical protein
MSVDEKERALFATWDRINARQGESPFDELPHAARVFLAIWALEAELNSGGFSQWMFNSSGDHAELAVAGLREVGADRAASVCERFFAMLSGGKPLADRNARQEQLDAAGAALGDAAFEAACQALEHEFYGLEDELRDRLWAFSLRQS